MSWRSGRPLSLNGLELCAWKCRLPDADRPPATQSKQPPEPRPAPSASSQPCQPPASPAVSAWPARSVGHAAAQHLLGSVHQQPSSPRQPAHDQHRAHAAAQHLLGSGAPAARTPSVRSGRSRHNQRARGAENHTDLTLIGLQRMRAWRAANTVVAASCAPLQVSWMASTCATAHAVRRPTPLSSARLLAGTAGGCAAPDGGLQGPLRQGSPQHAARQRAPNTRQRHQQQSI